MYNRYQNETTASSFLGYQNKDHLPSYKHIYPLPTIGRSAVFLTIWCTTPIQQLCIGARKQKASSLAGPQI
jgi:hypothetical protein